MPGPSPTIRAIEGASRSRCISPTIRAIRARAGPVAMPGPRRGSARLKSLPAPVGRMGKPMPTGRAPAAFPCARVVVGCAAFAVGPTWRGIDGHCLHANGACKSRSPSRRECWIHEEIRKPSGSADPAGVPRRRWRLVLGGARGPAPAPRGRDGAGGVHRPQGHERAGDRYAARRRRPDRRRAPLALPPLAPRWPRSQGGAFRPLPRDERCLHRRCAGGDAAGRRQALRPHRGLASARYRCRPRCSGLDRARRLSGRCEQRRRLSCAVSAPCREPRGLSLPGDLRARAGRFRSARPGAAAARYLRPTLLGRGMRRRSGRAAAACTSWW